MRRPLQFRSKKRDIDADSRRVLPIRRLIQAAIQDAKAELEGLSLRLQQTSDSAALLMGDGIESQAVGDAVLSADLDEMGRLTTRGETRRRHLKSQIATLQEVEGALRQILEPVPEVERR